MFFHLMRTSTNYTFRYCDGVRAACLRAGTSSVHPGSNRHDTKWKTLTPTRRSDDWVRSELRCQNDDQVARSLLV